MTARESGWGLFITFEGVEGTGKSTQARLLAEKIKQDCSLEVVLTREPGGTPLGESLRGVLLDSPEVPAPRAELLLMLAARAQHVDQVLMPSLKRGCVVICDRFSDATLAYQAGGRGLDLETVEQADRIAAAGLVPDLTLLLETSEAETANRLRRRSKEHSNRMDQETQTFYRAVSRTYQSLAAQHPHRIVRIASGGPIGATAKQVWKAAAERLARIDGVNL